MNKKQIIYLILTTVLIGILFVVFLNSGSGNPKISNKEEREYSTTNWQADFNLESKNPYGLYAFRELTIADGRFTEFNSISDYTLFDSIVQFDSSMFMFVGLDFRLTEEEIDLLLESVEYGNDLFVSAEKMPQYFLEHLFDEYPFTFFPTLKATHKINNKELNMYYFNENDTLTKLWNMIDPSTLDEYSQVHSTIYGRPNYIEIEYGLGKVFIHLNPIVFSNVQVLRKDGKSYLKEVISTLNQPKIQWLNFANFELKAYDKDSTEFEKDHSLLSELFKHPAFRWGFILAVFGLILYLLFRSKRSRPIIPAVEDNKNTGFSYVDTLAGIYYNKDHGDKILKIMRRNFYSAIYSHFYIDLSKREDKKALIALSKKSNVPLLEIEQLVKFLEVTTKVSDIFLSNTYKMQRTFYFQSGIWNEEVKKKIAQESTLIYHQKELSLGMVGLGVFTLILGFVFLSMSLGAGVLFWPIGIIGIAIGTRMLNIPAIELKKNQLEVNPLIGKKAIVLHENIKFIEENGGNITVFLKNGSKSVFNISRLDSKNRKAIDYLKQRYKQGIR